MNSMSLREMARALGGEVRKTSSGLAYVIAPGPGHSPLDRSLSVTLSSEEHDGFVVNSFANDDWRTCRDHVRSRLGMTTNRPEKGK